MFFPKQGRLHTHVSKLELMKNIFSCPSVARKFDGVFCLINNIASYQESSLNQTQHCPLEE